MSGWDDVLSVIEESASRQRREGRTVFSSIVPIAGFVPYDKPDVAVQDLVSEAVHRVERRGWKLDQVSAYSVAPARNASPSSEGFSHALLIFRAADH
ncbi:hypothetical protein [Nonomuraea sediminis]|uniref:hypothetical protein n=1 Tax=Nonomuraea sediminis TaxID=2835864 RepID=UPI001BDD29E1|nr:hypothetical protein [Nonomuraea sediminis]